MAGFSKSITSIYDLDSNRTRVTHPDAQAFTYEYDARDRLNGVYEGIGTGTALDGFIWNADDTLATRLEGGSSGAASYGYDAIGRLLGQGDTFPSFPGSNVSWTFGISPASQIVSETRDNDAYAFTGISTANKAYAVNGLNQYTAVAGTGHTYDANGNLTGDGTNAYIYDGENRLVSATAAGVSTTLTYDPLGRLWQVVKGGSNTRFLYDGDAIVGEYDGSGNLTNRYVHGSNLAADDPLLWYVGPGTGTKRYLHADHLGSVVAATNAAAAPTINAYDEYGVPKSGNVGRFQYTGQIWLSELGLYHYKARLYSPTLGRFLQVDPVGYKDQINLYVYVNDDPVNANDPSGLTCEKDGTDCKVDTVNGRKNDVSQKSYQKDTATHQKVNASANALQRAVNTLRANPDQKFTVTVKYMDTGSRLPQYLSQTFTYGQLANVLINTPLNVDTENHPELTRARGGPGSPITLYDRATLGSSSALQRTFYHEPIHYLDNKLQLAPNFNTVHQRPYKEATDSICHSGPDRCE